MTAKYESNQSLLYAESFHVHFASKPCHFGKNAKASEYNGRLQPARKKSSSDLRLHKYRVCVVLRLFMGPVFHSPDSIMLLWDSSIVTVIIKSQHMKNNARDFKSWMMNALPNTLISMLYELFAKLGEVEPFERSLVYFMGKGWLRRQKVERLHEAFGWEFSKVELWSRTLSLNCSAFCQWNIFLAYLAGISTLNCCDNCIKFPTTKKKSQSILKQCLFTHSLYARERGLSLECLYSE